MKQFTIAVLFLVSLVGGRAATAQSRASVDVYCDTQVSWYPAGEGKCQDLIESNRERTELAPIVNGRATLTEDGNNCAIFTNGGGVTRRDLALQAQVIVNKCSDNGLVTGRIVGGLTPNPACIVSKGAYVIFISVLMVWLKPSCVARATLMFAANSGGDVQYYTVVTAISRGSAIITVRSRTLDIPVRGRIPKSGVLSNGKYRFVSNLTPALSNFLAFCPEEGSGLLKA